MDMKILMVVFRNLRWQFKAPRGRGLFIRIYYTLIANDFGMQFIIWRSTLNSPAS